jgi:hypothetical protein
MNRSGLAFYALCLLLLVASLLPVAAALAQSGGPPRPQSSTTGFDLTWWTVDGGGTTSPAGSGYALGGTAGQPDGALWRGGSYTLAGGFWGRAALAFRVYLPLVTR